MFPGTENFLGAEELKYYFETLGSKSLLTPCGSLYVEQKIRFWLKQQIGYSTGKAICIQYADYIKVLLFLFYSLSVDYVFSLPKFVWFLAQNGS